MAERDLQTGQFALTADEVRRVINACATARDRCLLRALAETGVRRAEVAAIDVRDLDLKTRRVIIRSRKGIKERVLPITETLARELHVLLGGRSTGALFLSNRKGALTPRQVHRIVERAGQLAGVEDPNLARKGRVTCHLLRHTFARLWRERGGDFESLAHILGHTSSARTILLYGAQGVDDIGLRYQRIMDRT